MAEQKAVFNIDEITKQFKKGMEKNAKAVVDTAKASMMENAKDAAAAIKSIQDAQLKDLEKYAVRAAEINKQLADLRKAKGPAAESAKTFLRTERKTNEQQAQSIVREQLIGKKAARVRREIEHDDYKQTKDILSKEKRLYDDDFREAKDVQKRREKVKKEEMAKEKAMAKEAEKIQKYKYDSDYKEARDHNKKLDRETKETTKKKEKDKKDAYSLEHREAIHFNRQFDKTKKDAERKSERDAKLATRKQRDEKRNEMKESMHDAVLFHSALGAIAGPLPGGGIAMAGAYGYSSTSQRWKQGSIKRGEGKIGQAVAGMAGGVGGAAIMAGLAGLSMAVGGAVSGSQEEEVGSRSLARAYGGDPRKGNRAFRMGAGYGMTNNEAAPFTLQALQATRGQGGIDSVLRAQQGMGAGGEMAGLAGALTQGGAFGKSGAGIDETLKRALIDIFATGVAQGFENGNVAETMANATAAANERALGVIVKSSMVTEFSALQASLYNASGKDARFQGSAGAGAMQAYNNMVQGKGSPLSMGLALAANDVGKKGVALAKADAEAGLWGVRPSEEEAAEREISQAESGGAKLTDEQKKAIYAKYRTTGAQRFKKSLAQARKASGGKLAGTQLFLMGSQGMGAGFARATAKLKDSEITDERLKAEEEKHKTKGEKQQDLADQAFKAMVRMGQWKPFEIAVNELKYTLGMLLGKSGVLGQLLVVVNELTAMIRTALGAKAGGEKVRSTLRKETINPKLFGLDPDTIDPDVVEAMATATSDNLYANYKAAKALLTQPEQVAKLQNWLDAKRAEFAEQKAVQKKREAQSQEVADIGTGEDIGDVDYGALRRGERVLKRTIVKEVVVKQGSGSDTASRNESDRSEAARGVGTPVTRPVSEDITL